MTFKVKDGLQVGAVITVEADGKISWDKVKSQPTTIAGYGITDAPTKTGSGASGTWGISISGNAATATNADQLDGIDSTRVIYGTNGAGANTLNATQNVGELGQYKAGFWEVVNAAWAPTSSGYYWGTTLAHTSNSPTYNYSAQIAVQNTPSANAYIRTIANGTPAAWKQIAYVDGNVATATKLATARTIALSGDVSGSVTFDGSANATITATVADDSHSHKSVVVQDVRTTDPTPDASAPNAVTSYFTDVFPGLNSWHSALNVKGWTGAYYTWQLIGPANTTDDNNVYFRSGAGTTWGTMRKLWHDGNDGAGSGLDADKLDGMEPSTGATNSTSTPNTIMQRNVNGDTSVRQLFSNYVNMDHAQATRNTDTIFYSSTDGYVRKNTAAGIRKSLGLNTDDSPTFVTASLTGTGALKIPAGTTAERPAGATALIRYNSTLDQYEGYKGGDWGELGGGATGAPGNKVFQENDQNVTGDYTIPTGKNASSVGPININTGVTVTISSGSVWAII